MGWFQGWSTKDLVTAAVAVYGALLASYTAFSRWREKRVRLKVALKESYLVPNLAGRISRQFGIPGIVDTAPQMPKMHVLLVAANHGERQVTVCSCGLLISGKQVVGDFPGSLELPCKLSFGESCEMQLDPDIIRQELKACGFSGIKKVKGFFQDQLGNTYKSRAVKFQIS